MGTRTKRLLVLCGLVLLVVAAWESLRLYQEHAARALPEELEAIGGVFSAAGGVGRAHFIDARGSDLYFETRSERRVVAHAGAVQPRGLRLEAGWRGLRALGASSTLSIDLDSVEPRILELRCRSVETPPPQRRQTLSVACNGMACGTFELGSSNVTLRIPIPAEAQLEGRNLLVFTYGFHASQKELGTGDDRYSYAAHFRYIHLLRTAHRPGLLARIAAALSPFAQRAGVALDRRDQTIVFRRPGTLVVPLMLPPGAQAFELSAILDGSSTPPPALRAVLRGLDGSSSPPFELQPVPDHAPTSAGLSPRRLSASVQTGEVAGTTCLLVLERPPGPSSGSLKLEAPSLRLEPDAARNAAGPEPTPPATRLGPQGSAPDIVLITLDAARADHFGCYGYSRATSPNVDRLAAEGLVMRQAFALAPNTSYSVPTMITGLSFLRHGVTRHELRLSEEALTLAEQLREHGYQTLCFSATPNNSRHNGLAQGYDEFIGTWEVSRSQEQRMDPHFLSRLVVDRLHAVDASIPLHLQVHYVPPHMPYQPGPRFNRFADPDYDGHCTGERSTFNAISHGQLHPDDADRRHLVDLYDGNLLRADDAVGLVLDALRQRSRWRQTIVLVVADHGEAFYEHGRFGHNSTTYDEMLHVPFILRLPDSGPVPEVDPDRLVTLADIVPTLLHAASIEPPPGLDGMDLLDITRPAPPDRFFVASSASREPGWALRSRRWKAIVPVSGNAELYDVLHDPHERHNLVDDQEAIFAGLVKLLEYRLLTAPPPDLRAVRPDLQDSERRMLEALGYL